MRVYFDKMFRLSLLFVLFMMPVLCPAQNALYYFPDSVEIRLFDYLYSKSDVNIDSGFFVLETSGDGYRISYGELLDDSPSEIISLVSLTKRKAVINSYRIPIVLDNDFDFYLFCSKKALRMKYLITFLPNGIIIDEQNYLFKCPLEIVGIVSEEKKHHG